MDITSYLLGKNSGGSGPTGKFKPHEMSFANRSIKSGETSRVIALQNDINNIDTSEMTYMGKMFDGLSVSTSLYEGEVNLDLSGWNTSNITSFEYMFNSIGFPFSVNMSSFSFNNVAYGRGLANMFYSSKIKNLIVPQTTKHITSCYFKNMFYYAGEIELIDLDFLDNSDTPYLDTTHQDFTGMFQNCEKVKTIKAKNLHTCNSQTNVITYMFANCYLLERLDLDNFEFNDTRISSTSSKRRDCFANCGLNLPEGQYTKIYVKDETAQNWILNTSNIGRPAGWSTANVIIAGSEDDHRTD